MKKTKLYLILSITILVFIGAVVGLIYSKLDNKSYTVTFDSNGGSGVVSQVINKGDTVSKPIDPVREGYIFIEWDYNGVIYDFSTKVNSDIILVAKWEEVSEDIVSYTVTFDTDGGTDIANQVVKEGDKVSKPNDPVKDGYVFKGWLVNNTSYDFDTIVSGNITIKASWEKVSETVSVNKYTVTFNSNGGSSVKSQSVSEGSKVSKPSNPTRSGYTFSGWTLNGNSYDFNSKVGSNITLVAKWDKVNEESKEEVTVKEYTVTFDSNGGSSIGKQTVKEGNTVVKPSDPTKSGYVFTGWSLNGKSYDFNTKVSGNITLVANYRALYSYTITFDSNGGSSVGKQVVNEGSKVSKPSNPTKEGYNFVSWQLNGSNYDFNSSVNGNITLVAKWSEKSYTVKVSIVDSQSPERVLTVYQDGSKINVSAIYLNNTKLCDGSNMTVNKFEIEGVSSLTVVLSSGTKVTASVS